MTNFNSVIQKLQALDEDELIAQLGMRAEAIKSDPSEATIESLEEPLPLPRASWDDLLKTGQNLLSHTSAEAYKLMCTPIGGNGELAKELDQVLNEKTAEAAAKATSLLAPVLVSSLGLPQSLAVLLGTLIVKKLAKGTSDFICDRWQQSLGIKSTTPPTTIPASSPTASAQPSTEMPAS